jgi:hypothetical protein
VVVGQDEDDVARPGAFKNLRQNLAGDGLDPGKGERSNEQGEKGSREAHDCAEV